MTTGSGRTPRLTAVWISRSGNFVVKPGMYASLEAVDEELAAAYASVPPRDTRPYDVLMVALRWDDGHQVEQNFYVGREHVDAANDAGLGLLSYLLLAAALHAAAGSPGETFEPRIVEQRRQRAQELLRRLIPDAHRNAANAPRVERVAVTVNMVGGTHRLVFDSIALADVKLGELFATAPIGADDRLGWVGGIVEWSDNYELQARFFVTREHLMNAQADGGILRHALLRDARLEAARSSHAGLPRTKAARRMAQGREMLARIEADALDDDMRRNAATPAWTSPSLLPDPAEAIRRLRDRFGVRREIVRAIGEWDGDERAAYPATNHADVRYVVNFISLALRNDVATLPPTAGAIIWNHWTSVRDTIETLLRGRDDTDRYEDNEGLWVRQLPALVRLLNEAREEGSPLRNGRLNFRPVGGRGDAYPSWVADLRGRSGVYVIRAPGESGDLEIVYVGSSSADRLHETLTRHFQIWRRWKGFWRGQYSEGHDPGLTYDRDTSEAAVIITPPQHAYELEMRLIRRLRPRDNLLGQAGAEEEIPF